MPIDPLEEYAQGFTPQQGSVLAPGTQGGLPFGSQAPVPPRAPAPMPQLPALPQQGQRPPLAQIGGQAPDVMQMLQELLRSLQGINPAKAKFSEAVKYYNALEEIPKLTGIANIRSQDRQMRQGALKQIGETLKAFNALSLEQQIAQRSVFQRLLSAYGQSAGLNATPDDVTEALSTPNITKAYADIFNDELIDPMNAASRLGLAKDSTQRENVRALIRKEAEQRAQTIVQQHLPLIATQLRAGSSDLIDAGAIASNPQVQEFFKKSPTTERVFNDFISNKANSETLVGWGIKPGSIVVKVLEGPKMTETAQELLAAMFTGPNGKPLTPALATSKQIAGAVKASQDQRLMESMRKGEGAAALAMSLPAAAEERDQHIDVNTLISSGQIVKPPAGITVGELRKGAYRFARPEQQKALMALQPQRTAFGDMNAVADKLITAERWQDALAQGIRLHVGARTGSDPIARAYQDSVAAATSYLARMVESGVMTDQDVARWQSAATSSFFDTKQSRAVKIALMGDIIDAAQQAVISQVAGVPGKKPTALKEQLAKLDRLTQDTWKNTRAGLQPGETLITDGKGRYGKLQKGYKLPAGWQEVK